LFAFIWDYNLATMNDCCYQGSVDQIQLIEGDGTALPRPEEDLFMVPRSHQLFSVYLAALMSLLLLAPASSSSPHSASSALSGWSQVSVSGKSAGVSTKRTSIFLSDDQEDCCLGLFSVGKTQNQTPLFFARRFPTTRQTFSGKSQHSY
jgi:hypothetical protein